METSIIIGLFVFALLFLAAALYVRSFKMVRIDNWNGRRFCLLGYAPIRKEGNAFAVFIKESLVDLSHTTLYRICPGKSFYKRHKYRDLFVYAEGAKQYLVMEKQAMKTEIPF